MEPRTWWNTDTSQELWLSEEGALAPAGMVAAGHDEAPVEFKTRHIEKQRTSKEDWIAWEGSTTPEKIVTNE